MKIKRLKIKGLFERNYDIDFYEDITLLYGVNGCGKTTILNILSTIISGELHDLKNYDFKSLELHVSEHGVEKSEDKLIINETTHNIPLYQVYFKGKVALIPKGVNFDDGSYKKKSVSKNKKYMDREEFLEGTDEHFDKYFNELVYEIKNAFYQLYIPLTRNSVSIDQLQERNMILRGNGSGSYSETATHFDNSVNKAVELLREYKMKITMKENRIFEKLKGQILNLALSSNEVEIDNLDLKDIFI